MYGALWRSLPGPAWVRVILVLIIVAAVVAALFTWVFPWVQELVDTQDVTVGGTT
ncbi:DUF4175 domain-containing protein [Mycetocola reblochoni]|uniref:Uncharacterized protein n=1 Tax=Mycetocola reblochoni REB411 TaxID=1255698 RepID=A0A1R4JFB1_9MICO|nr:DUF4175 domain-containing protein [Mycetocola reblochoni]SJN30871.1 hypothetical protein FM119_07300 [Mycetocola reblochoni REB411]